MSDSSANQSVLLGKRVEVIYGPSLIVVGKLLAFSAAGEFTIKDDEDVVWHCWPGLHMRLADGG